MCSSNTHQHFSHSHRKSCKPDILQSNELEKCYFFEHNLSNERDHGTISHAIQTIQSTNNIETQTFRFWPSTLSLYIFFLVLWCISVNIFTAGKLWLLYKIGFLFCGNYPFVWQHNLIRSTVLFKSKHTHVLRHCRKKTESEATCHSPCFGFMSRWILTRFGIRIYIEVVANMQTTKSIGFDFGHHFYGENFHDKIIRESNSFFPWQ